jgi:streptogramin lyase
MLTRDLSVRVLACCTALAFAACSGGGTVPSKLAGAAPVGTVKKKAAVHVSVRIPAPRKTHNRHLLHQQFISASTQSIEVQVYLPNSAHNSANLLATTIGNVASGSSICTTNTDGSRNCTFLVAIPPPADDIAFSTWDQQPSGNAIPPGARQLAAANLIDQKITSGEVNNIAVTLGGIVTRVSLSMPFSTTTTGVNTSSIHGVAASVQTYFINAFDADGNLIVSDGFVDVFGNPLSINSSVSPSSATCGSGTLSLSGGAGSNAVSLAHPSSSGVQFSYGASTLAQVFTSGNPCTFAISANIGVAQASAQFALLGPEFTEKFTPSGAFTQIASDGSDGNVWFTEPMKGQIGVLKLSTGNITEFAAESASSQPFGITSGPNSSLWVANSQAAAGISEFATTGTMTTTVGGSGTNVLKGIAAGSDGNLWATDSGNSKIAKITPSGTVSEFTITAASSPLGIVAGPDGNLWFAENAANKIGKITTSGAVTEFSIPTSASGPSFLTVGNDGALWFTETTANKIGRITTAGTFTEYPIPSATTLPTGIAQGGDGAIWFTEAAPPGRIGRIPLSATANSGAQITEYAVPSTGVSVQPYSLVAGVDGALYFTDTSSNDALWHFGW